MAFDLTAHLRIVDQATRPLRGITSALMGTVGKFGALSAAAIGVSGAFAGISVVTDSFKKAMDFEAQLSTIQALTGATGEEMAEMQSLALKMGASTKYNAMEAAQGIEELLKSGLSPATVKAGGLEAALNLATAGGLGLADAAEIMSTALNAYKDDNMSAADAANILAGTANASATGVMDLRYSLAAVSAVASGIGMSFQDTNIAMGLFANNGLKGSDAGTSLKTMLMNLSPATKAARSAMKELGIITKQGTNTFFDANGELKDLASISGILQKALSKLNKQQQQDYLRELFGSDAIRAGNILLKEGAEGVAKFQKEMSKVTALDVAKKKMDNAAGAVEQFNGALETLQISALMPTMPIIKDFAISAANMVEKYSPAITAAVQKAVDNGKKYIFDNFTNNPAFNRLPTFKSKVEFVFDTVQASFDAWWGSSGQSAFEGYSEKITKTLVDSLEGSSEQIASVGLSIGKSLMTGIMDGMRESEYFGWLIKTIDFGMAFDQGMTDVSKGFWDLALYQELGAGDAKAARRAEKERIQAEYSASPKVSLNPIGGFNSGGLSDLKNAYATKNPFTQPMPVTNNTTVTVNMGGATIREEADIGKIARSLYTMISDANNANAKPGGKRLGGASEY
ncbi:phage tail tape measure protein [Paenibacillus sp. BIHB 4019]|uniref:Phage tail tape measure protein n=1 Tax=Paenibacillus sp. BIHB 4019 TaxID=1870819 RepID=A0A1B2DJ66_9BACL|nr:phage tail tape measure protein [Paenibacillus sp. BIHB 4019]ANY67739.1 phage tail tape measure protein [Paenibacillus sp. BIHB 4019]